MGKTNMLRYETAKQLIDDASPEMKTVSKAIECFIYRWLMELIEYEHEKEFLPYFRLGYRGKRNTERLSDIINYSIRTALLATKEDTFESSGTIEVISQKRWNKIVNILRGVDMEYIGRAILKEQNSHNLSFTLVKNGPSVTINANYITMDYNIPVISLTVTKDGLTDVKFITAGNMACYNSRYVRGVKRSIPKRTIYDSEELCEWNAAWIRN